MIQATIPVRPSNALLHDFVLEGRSAGLATESSSMDHAIAQIDFQPGMKYG
jgi:hypothetical protein